MFLLILLELISLIIYLIILIYTFGLDTTTEYNQEIYVSNLITSILSITLEALAIALIIVFGIHALYFKIIHKLIWYIIW